MPKHGKPDPDGQREIIFSSRVLREMLGGAPAAKHPPGLFYEPALVAQLQAADRSSAGQLVLDFISRFTGMRVSPDSRLVTDLNIDGHEARAFIAAFALKFKVDLRAFRIQEHFHESPVMHPLQYCGRLVAKSPDEINELRVRDMIRAAKEKRLA